MTSSNQEMFKEVAKKLELRLHKHISWTFVGRKALPLLFQCVFWGISPNFICSHVPMEKIILQNGKEAKQ
jgi:hypothetical protein